MNCGCFLKVLSQINEKIGVSVLMFVCFCCLQLLRVSMCATVFASVRVCVGEKDKRTPNEVGTIS